jgi:hypothetical protein
MLKEKRRGLPNRRPLLFPLASYFIFLASLYGNNLKCDSALLITACSFQSME